MSKILTTLEQVALDMVQASYDTVPSIAAEIRLLLGNGVSNQQIMNALVALRDEGLVHAFHHREEDGVYIRFKRPQLKAGAEVWWHATEAGRKAAAAS